MLRVITKYCPAYREFSVAVEYHLHHQYSAAMARKTEQVLIQCMWVVLALYQVFILISRHYWALISITFQPFTKVVDCTRCSDSRGWCAVFSVHISLHCPHDMNALNRLSQSGGLCISFRGHENGNTKDFLQHSGHTCVMRAFI